MLEQRTQDLKDWVSKSNLFTFAMLDGIVGCRIRIFGYKEFFVLLASLISYTRHIHAVGGTYNIIFNAISGS